MAGIAGIIRKKNHTPSESNLHSCFASMMQKMSFSGQQLHHTVFENNVCFGNVMPIGSRVNTHYQYNSNLNIHVVVEGLVFVDRHERESMAKKYGVEGFQTDYAVLPFLYDQFHNDLVNHITGWFNIFIYDRKEHRSLLVNDHFGLHPLYYHESDSCFVFASKIEAVLHSGLLPTVQPDPVTIAEHLFFNYPLSDHTYIKDVSTLANAQQVMISRDKVTASSYWSIGEWFDFPPAGRDESFHLLDSGLSQAVRKVIDRCDGTINQSLTGGWDSRVVLSYCLPEYKDKLNLYSFGAEWSDDIQVPKHIARTEGLAYSPYVLDQAYLDGDFIPNAVDTILLSNGTRNFKRTHYLYAVKKICDKSNFLITGIFGDEVFKVGKPSGGEVLSGNTVNLLQSDFDLDQILETFSAGPVLQYLDTDSDALMAEFRARLEAVKNRMNVFETVAQKYCSIRFEYNLRKYFGAEINSYNDFVFCASPFIDQDFFKKFAQTRFFGIHYDFDASSLHLKKQSTRLYHDIVKNNYPPLTAYLSARGYSMKDAAHPLGNLKILYQKYFSKRKKVDAFNTDTTVRLFASFLSSQNLHCDVFKSFQSIPEAAKDPNYLSLFFWLASIEKKQ